MKQLPPELADGVISENGDLLSFYSVSMQYQNTKLPKLRFHVVLGAGAREVHFERATGLAPRGRSVLGSSPGLLKPDEPNALNWVR
jgi:hypothetical protein